MKKSSDKFPPLMVVSGGQDLLRRRFVNQVVSVQEQAGWSIQEVDGAVPGDVQEALAGDMFSPRQTLAVVTNPEKVDLDLLEAHHTSKDYITTLFLVIDGEPDGRTKFGKAVKGSWSSVHKNFPLPTEWKAPEVAAAFVQEEAQRYGQQMPAGLAVALVQRSGTDLGVLAFEVEKIAILASLAGVKVIEPKHVALGHAPIAEASVLPVVDALATKQAKKLARHLADVRRTSKDDQTMRVSRLIASSAMKWMQAAYLDALPPKAAAEELGVHPWYFENKILPASRRWGKRGTVRLITDLAASERAVLSGAVDPWLVLTSRLLSACRSPDGPSR